jgi:hypothetical protein
MPTRAFSVKFLWTVSNALVRIGPSRRYDRRCQWQCYKQRCLRALSRMQRPGAMAISETRMRAEMIMNSITAKTL